MKKQKLSKEALEAYNVIMKLSEEDKQLVFRKVSQPDAPEPEKTEPKDGWTCPHCGSSHIRRNGKTPSGYQRLIYVDCHKTSGKRKGLHGW